MLSVPLPRRWALQTPGAVRHLPRCRLFPLIAPAAAGPGPRFDRFAAVPIRFVRSAPARLAGRPGRLVTAAHVCNAASAPYRVVDACRVGRYSAATRRIPFVVFGPSRRGSRASARRSRRVRSGPSWLRDSDSAWAPARARVVALPPPVAGRAVLGCGVRARLSAPRVSTPPHHLLRVSTPVSSPRRRLVPPSTLRACQAAARLYASAAAPRLRFDTDLARPMRRRRRRAN